MKRQTTVGAAIRAGIPAVATSPKRPRLDLATLLWTGGTIALLVAPIRLGSPPVEMSLPYLDKVVHFTLFLGVSALWRSLLAARSVRFPALLALGLGVALGGATELAQLYVPYRDCDLYDFLADAAGSAAGVLLPLPARFTRST